MSKEEFLHDVYNCMVTMTDTTEVPESEQGKIMRKLESIENFYEMTAEELAKLIAMLLNLAN